MSTTVGRYQCLCALDKWCEVDIAGAFLTLTFLTLAIFDIRGGQCGDSQKDHYHVWRMEGWENSCAMHNKSGAPPPPQHWQNAPQFAAPQGTGRPAHHGADGAGLAPHAAGHDQRVAERVGGPHAVQRDEHTVQWGGPKAAGVGAEACDGMGRLAGEKREATGTFVDWGE